MSENEPNLALNRRQVLTEAAAIAAILPAASAVSAGAFAGGTDLLKVGLVGCGGRGTGAAVNASMPTPPRNSSPSPMYLKIERRPAERSCGGK